MRWEGSFRSESLFQFEGLLKIQVNPLRALDTFPHRSGLLRTPTVPVIQGGGALANHALAIAQGFVDVPQDAELPFDEPLASATFQKRKPWRVT